MTSAASQKRVDLTRSTSQSLPVSPAFPFLVCLIILVVGVTQSSTVAL
jgi:hypothetical protein